MDDVTKTKRADVYPIGKKNPNLPFHPAVRAGDFIFVSGQVAKGCQRQHDRRHDRGGDPRHDRDPSQRILAQEGATLADVVRATTYLQDTRDFGRYNKVFGEMFKDAILARTTVEARAVINTKIEIDCHRLQAIEDVSAPCAQTAKGDYKRDQSCLAVDLRQRPEGAFSRWKRSA